MRKSDDAISGLKKISGAKNRSYPTSTLYFWDVSFLVSHESDAKKTSYLSSDRMFALVNSKVLFGIFIVLSEFLDHIPADVAKVLLDLLGYSEGVLGRDVVLSSVSEELLDKGRDISSGDGDMLDRRSDYVSFSLCHAQGSA